MKNIWKDPARRGSGIGRWLLIGAGFVFWLIVLLAASTLKMQLELIGEDGALIEYGQPYADPGVRPTVQGSLPEWEPDVKITASGAVDVQKLGEQTVTYTASWLWLEASVSRTVRVVDRECPVITLHSDPDYEWTPGSAYREEGFTATDNRDGDITHRVRRIEHLGLVTYAVLDSSGNPAYAQREIPEYDYQPPELTLNGYRDVTITAGTRYQDPGCTAADNVDGDLTSQVRVDGEVVWYKKGTYTLEYSVTDSYGNTATTQRIVRVTPRPRQETVDPGNRVIYLTFDDGPGPHTRELLDLLDSYDVQATFFVMNNGYYDLLREMVEKGHSIGIHTRTHKYREIYASVDAYFDDLYGMQDIIEEQTGVKTWLMRFPGGSSNSVSCFSPGIMTTLTAAVQEAGFHYFDWNVDSNDAGGAKTADEVFRNVTNGIVRQNVSIVLQHDVQGFSVDAVERILIWGFENGYTFLPLREDSPTVHHPLNN